MLYKEINKENAVLQSLQILQHFQLKDGNFFRAQYKCIQNLETSQDYIYIFSVVYNISTTNVSLFLHYSKFSLL